MPSLQISLPDGDIFHFDLSEEELISIGRDPESHISLDADTASFHHAALKQENGVWRLEDQGSTNGTFIHEVRTKSHVLTHGDQFVISVFSFTFVDEPKSAAVPIPVAPQSPPSVEFTPTPLAPPSSSVIAPLTGAAVVPPVEAKIPKADVAAPAPEVIKPRVTPPAAKPPLPLPPQAPVAVPVKAPEAVVVPPVEAKIPKPDVVAPAAEVIKPKVTPSAAKPAAPLPPPPLSRTVEPAKAPEAIVIPPPATVEKPKPMVPVGEETKPTVVPSLKAPPLPPPPLPPPPLAPFAEETETTFGDSGRLPSGKVNVEGEAGDKKVEGVAPVPRAPASEAPQAPTVAQPRDGETPSFPLPPLPLPPPALAPPPKPVPQTLPATAVPGSGKPVVPPAPESGSKAVETIVRPADKPLTGEVQPPLGPPVPPAAALSPPLPPPAKSEGIPKVSEAKTPEPTAKPTAEKIGPLAVPSPPSVESGKPGVAEAPAESPKISGPKAGPILAAAALEKPPAPPPPLHVLHESKLVPKTIRPVPSVQNQPASITTTSSARVQVWIKYVALTAAVALFAFSAYMLWKDKPLSTSQARVPAMREPDVEPDAKMVLTRKEPEAPKLPPFVKAGTEILLDRDALKVVGEPVLSPDLEKIVYCTLSEQKATVEGQALYDLHVSDQKVAVVSEIPDASQVWFSADGSQWAVKIVGPEAATPDGLILLKDRKLPLRGALLVFAGSRDFSKVAMVVAQGDGERLYLEKDEVSQGQHITDLQLSSDGNHWACVVELGDNADMNRLPGPVGGVLHPTLVSIVEPETLTAATSGTPRTARVTVVQDSRSQPSHTRITQLALSADAARIAYVAEDETKDGLTISLFLDGKVFMTLAKGKGTPSSLTFSPDGKRFGYAVVYEDRPPDFLVEGQEDFKGSLAQPGTGGSASAAGAWRVSPILFSRDGSHTAFAYSGPQAAVVKDNVLVGSYPGVLVDSLRLSDQGEHLAYVVSPAPEPSSKAERKAHHLTHSLCLDGKVKKSINVVSVRQAGISTLTIGGFSHAAFLTGHDLFACIASSYRAEQQATVAEVVIDFDTVEESKELQSVLLDTPTEGRAIHVSAAKVESIKYVRGPATP